jgi:hypothetical protein
VTVEVETPKMRATSERERKPPPSMGGEASVSGGLREGVMTFGSTISSRRTPSYDARHVRERLERYGPVVRWLRSWTRRTLPRVRREDRIGAKVLERSSRRDG